MPLIPKYIIGYLFAISLVWPISVLLELWTLGIGVAFIFGVICINSFRIYMESRDIVNSNGKIPIFKAFAYSLIITAIVYMLGSFMLVINCLYKLIDSSICNNSQTDLGIPIILMCVTFFGISFLMVPFTYHIQPWKS